VTSILILIAIMGAVLLAKKDVQKEEVSNPELEAKRVEERKSGVTSQESEVSS